MTLATTRNTTGTCRRCQRIAPSMDKVRRLGSRFSKIFQQLSKVSKTIHAICNQDDNEMCQIILGIYSNFTIHNFQIRCPLLHVIQKCQQYIARQRLLHVSGPRELDVAVCYIDGPDNNEQINPDVSAPGIGCCCLFTYNQAIVINESFLTLTSLYQSYTLI